MVTFQGLLVIFYGARDIRRKKIVSLCLTIQYANVTYNDSHFLLLTGKDLRFLPGTFVFEDNKLAVYGYVAIKYKDHWCAVLSSTLKDKEANAICKTGKYASGKYDAKYNKGNMTRDSLTRGLLGHLYCNGGETNVTSCEVSRGNSWMPKDDGGVKCLF